MVRMRSAPARASASRREVSQERSETEVGVGAALTTGLASLALSTDVPSTGELVVVPESSPVVPEEGAAATEEEGGAGPSRKRKMLVQLSDVPSRPMDQVVTERQRKRKKKAQAARPGRWESTLTLSKNASFGDLEVTRYIAERVIPPMEEQLMEKRGNVELVSQLVRTGVRAAATSFAVLQRVEALDQEVRDLHERMKTVRDELAAAREGSNLLQAKNESLEEEKRSHQKEKAVLEGRLDKAEEEREKEKEKREREKEKEKRERENNEWKTTVRMERERIKQYRRDCRSAVEGRETAEKALRELQGSVKKQRIEAIKRWRERFLYEESLELTCEVNFSVLTRAYELYAPKGEASLSFKDFAEPLIPEALGLSLEEITERVERGEVTIPDEELDRSSDGEGFPPEDVPPAAPQGPAPALIVSLDEEELPSDVPLVASSDPAPLPSEASPQHSPVSGYSPGYTPSPPADT